MKNGKKGRESALEIKLIAIDMDGTLLQDDHCTVSEKNQSAIKAAIEKGILIVPASGRMYTFLPKMLMEIPGIRYSINSNGAAVYDLEKNKPIYTNFISNATVLKVLQEVPKEKYLFEIYVDGVSYTERYCQEHLSDYGLPSQFDALIYKKRTVVDDIIAFVKEKNPGVEKINLPYILGDFRTYLWNKLLSFGDLEIVSSIPCNMEVNNKTCSKGDALLHLCKYLNIYPENVMAIGDGGNDIRMLKEAGCPVAMANSEEEVKQAAKFVVSSNMQDGVAEAIRKFALS